MSYSYELMYILRPDLLEEQVQQEINKYRDFLSDHKAEEIKIKNWGKRRLAYPIKKQQDGFYVQMNFKGDGQQIAPIERAMRLSDEVIRYLTTKYKDEELAATEPSELAAEPSKPAPEPPSPKSITEPTKAVAESPRPPVEEVVDAEAVSAEE